MGRNSGGIWAREQSQLQFIVKILKINDVIRLEMQGPETQCSSRGRNEIKIADRQQNILRRGSFIQS